MSWTSPGITSRSSRAPCRMQDQPRDSGTRNRYERTPLRNARFRCGLDDDGTLDPHEEGGRGLFLVETLSSRWAWYPAQELAGKVVWCEIEALSPTRRGVWEGRETPFVRINRPADMGAAGQRGRRASPGLAVTLGQGSRPGSSGRSPGTAGLVSAAAGQARSTWPGLSTLSAGKAARAAKIWHLPNAAAAGLRRVWYLTAIACPARGDRGEGGPAPLTAYEGSPGRR